MITLENVKEDKRIVCYMQKGNSYIGNIGAIEHNAHHAELTASLCKNILKELGGSHRECELAAIAGFLHDIGNLINRYDHGMSGAMMAFYILLDMGMDPEEIAIIMGAIGNHEERAQGNPVNNVAAALTLADKSDVDRSRVRKSDFSTFTARDRVNYAVSHSDLLVDAAGRTVTMRLLIDIKVCPVMEYFEIFLTKMLMCRRAAEHLHCEFKLMINDVSLL